MQMRAEPTWEKESRRGGNFYALGTVTLEGDGCAAGRRGRLLDVWSPVQYLFRALLHWFLDCDAAFLWFASVAAHAGMR